MATSIGRYTIIRPLGAGGMADVYLAHDPTLDRTVALKMPSMERLDPEVLARFKAEAKAVARLEHPAIVPLYDYGDHDGRPYLVMRYLPGGSLADRLQRRAFNLNEALGIIERIAAALDYAHRQGVLHRDVKPGNILFDESGAAYLSDFGIARLMNPAGGQSLTRTGLIIGTVAYMSPEQVLGNTPLDGRSDVYSLGVVIFEMLSGDVPYQADSQLQQAMQHVNAPIPSIATRRPDLPTGTQAVINRALAKQPKERYATAAAPAADLRRLTGGAAPAARAGVSRLVWLVGLVGLVVLVLFAKRVWVSSKDDPIATLQKSAIATIKGTATNLEPVPTAGATSTLIILQELEPSQANDATPLRSTALPQAGNTRVITLVGGVDVEQVFVPAGAFLMGSRDDPAAKGNEYPQHEVYVDAFWLDKTEVSNQQFAAFVGATNYRTAAEQIGNGRVRVETGWVTVEGVDWRNPTDPDEEVSRNLPVVQVSWDDAYSYCTWVGGRLPTEAEWEYAARGSSGARYPWGESFVGQIVNYCDQNCPYSWADTGVDDGFETIAPVGSYSDGVSWAGAYDMIGNVWEWTNDWYANGYYEDTIYANPPGPETGDFRVLRGGAWYNLTETMRPAERGSDRPNDHDNGAGFRCVSEVGIFDTPLILTDTLPTPTIDLVPALTDLPFFMTRLVTAVDLRGLSQWELDVMRNEIFARHGRGFDRADLQAYFDQQPWYTRLYDPGNFPTDRLLTGIQKSNVEFILNHQQ